MKQGVWEPREHAPGRVGLIALALARWGVACLIIGLPLYGVRWGDSDLACLCDAAGSVAAGTGVLLWVLGYILGLVGSEQRGGIRALQISLAVLVGFLLTWVIAALMVFLHPRF